MLILRELIGKNIPALVDYDIASDKTPDKIGQWQSRRKEIHELLTAHVYGRIIAAANNVSYSERLINGQSFAGKAVSSEIRFDFCFGKETFSFNVLLILPKTHRPPVAVFPNFKKEYPDCYFPAEELVDRGIGVATFFYQDVALDSGNAFDSGLAKVLAGDRTKVDSAGTISIWAWACSRVADYLLQRQDIDSQNLMVAGHSRLGKTALLTGARDTRFKFVFANNAGCSGDSLARATGSDGEQIHQIVKTFPYWFCPRYHSYANNVDALPLDQHFLAAMIAPRFVCCGLAEQDKWAGLSSQYLCYVLASEAWKVYGKQGLTHPDRKIEPGDRFISGEIGVYMRRHNHYFSREDWNNYIDFFDCHSQ